jgi:enamine deaminase RidA (YjgF/YER057c/UK114 family)
MIGRHETGGTIAMAKLTRKNPDGMHAPVGRYVHVVAVEASKSVVLSGQVGVRPDGSIPEGAAEQADQLIENIMTALKSEGLAAADIVKITAYLTDREALPAWRAAREKLFGSVDTASTLLFVAGLADPKFLIEVDVEAAA